MRRSIFIFFLSLAICHTVFESSVQSVHHDSTKGQLSDDYYNTCLSEHNNYRGEHGVPALKLDSRLCNSAQKWADHIANTGTFEHSRSDYGENLFAMSGEAMMKATKESVKDWYDEIEYYDYTNPSPSHFTQVVWKSTEYLGLGVAKGSNWTYVVCQYDPPGNVDGEYKKNVPPPTNKVNAGSDTTSVGDSDDGNVIDNSQYRPSLQ